MSKILVITGSARPKSTNSIVVDEVVKNLESREGVEAKVANLLELDLPFVDSNASPSAPNFEITDERVQTWTDMVKDADGVVFVVPEYNHGLSGIQKNAIDWIYNEWVKKPAAFVGYGAYAAKHSYEHFQEINKVIQLSLGEKMAGLQLGEDLDWEGSIKNPESVKKILDATLDELIAKL